MSYIIIAYDGERARPLMTESGYFAEYKTISECASAIELHPFNRLECWALETNRLYDSADLIAIDGKVFKRGEFL